MKKVICTCCGSSKVVFENQNYKCMFCKTNFTEDFSDSKMYIDLCHANNERQSAQFEKSKNMYLNMIKNYPQEDLTDVYWGLFLCEHSILFEENGKLEEFPCFYKIGDQPITQSQSYQKALHYAKNHNIEKYDAFVELGDKIEKARKSYTNIAKSTKPFDIFICYKSQDEYGNQTKDRQLAMDIYNEFSDKYNIFFSEKTLSNIKSLYREYEPNIYYGLYTSKVIILICSKNEYLESKWLKNEWLRFSKINQYGINKCIIPIFAEGYNPNDLPTDLWHTQGLFDDRKLINNLSIQLETILHPVDMLEELKKEQERQKYEQEQMMAIQERAFNDKLKLLERNNMGITVGKLENYTDAIVKFLKIENYQKAEEALLEIKKYYPNAFEGYYYEMFIKRRTNDVNKLCLNDNVTESESFKSAKLFASKEEQKQLVQNIENATTLYKDNLLKNTYESLNNDNYEKFAKHYEDLVKFDKNSFFAYYLGLFYKFKVTKLSDLVKVQDVKDDENYRLAVINCTGYENLINQFDLAYKNYEEHLMIDIEHSLKERNFNDFCTYFELLKKFDTDCFETQFYELFYKNKVTTIADLAKVSNITTCREFYELLEKRNTIKQFDLIEELKKEADDYLSKLVFDVRKSFEIKDKKMFRKYYEELNNYTKNFEAYYFGIFYENEIFSIQDIKTVPNLLDSSNYINAKKYAIKQEDIELIEKMTEVYEKGYQNNVLNVEKQFDKINTFDDLYDTYKRLNNNSNLVNKVQLKQILYSYYADIYFEKLTEVNKILDQAMEKLDQKVNYKKLHNIYENTNEKVKELFENVGKVQTLFDNDNITDKDDEIVHNLEVSLIEKNKYFLSKIKNHLEDLTTREAKKQKAIKIAMIVSMIGLGVILLLSCMKVINLTQDMVGFTSKHSLIFKIILVADLLTAFEFLSFKIVSKKVKTLPSKIVSSQVLTLGFAICIALIALLIYSTPVFKYVLMVVGFVPYIESLIITCGLYDVYILVVLAVLMCVIYQTQAFKLQKVDTELMIDKKLKTIKLIEKIVLLLAVALLIIGVVVIANFLINDGVFQIENFKVIFENFINLKL
ncbi:MAG: TIR domain-containing protein [Clostridia bacterium]|nr:TIR domain-containing protein [Clostridia bacterium]